MSRLLPKHEALEHVEIMVFVNTSDVILLRCMRVPLTAALASISRDKRQARSKRPSQDSKKLTKASPSPRGASPLPKPTP